METKKFVKAVYSVQIKVIYEGVLTTKPDRDFKIKPSVIFTVTHSLQGNKKNGLKFTMNTRAMYLGHP